VLAALAAMACGAHAQQWTLARIADTSTPVPGGSGTFGIGNGIPFGAPSLGGGDVIFWGRSGSGEGVYGTRGGVLAAFANAQTPIPGSSSPFTSFRNPGLSTDGVAPTFVGGSLGAGYGGVYSNIGGQLVTVVESRTSLPDGTGTFGGTLSIPSREGQNVTFMGGPSLFSNFPSGVYRSAGGQLGTLADSHTAIPGGTGNFAGFAWQGLSGASVAFTGFDANFRRGIYRVPLAGGAVSLVADPSTPRPGGQGTLTSPDYPSISGDNIAFVDVTSGFPSQRSGYARIGGILTAVAVPGMSLPDGSTLTGCSSVSISGDSVAFVGYTNSYQGIFVWHAGQFQTVVRSDGTLGGISAAVFDLSPEAFEGNTLAFAFYDGTGNFGGVYTATIPAPGAGALLLAAGCLAARRRR
jgi:hypothetical protein